MEAEIRFQPLISKYVVEVTSIFGLLMVIGFQFYTKETTYAVASLVIFIASISRIAPSVLRIQQNILQIKSASGASESTLRLIFELRNEKEFKNSSVRNETNYNDFIPEVIIDIVSFEYPSSSFTLAPIKLRIKPGSVVAIVGPSGSGKSTLVDLILGVISDKVGKITISGLEPKAAITKWPGAISYVPQNVFINSGTIRQNVEVGYETQTDNYKHIMYSLEVAQLKDEISTFTDGLNTIVGERGDKISGGQRQRLGIARAIFSSPRLIVFDESTNALDGSTEQKLTDSIYKLSGNATIILVAHRVATIKNADLVVYMESGRVKASGTFNEVRNMLPEFDEQVRSAGF